MPLNLAALPLAPEPTSVHTARNWVRHVLSRLDRTDILEAAELGVSELVTNAILHGTPPISVRVRGTRDHPRVEVRDASDHPPEVNLRMLRDSDLMSTFGRGLGLVSLNSSAWGAELVPDGKVVWFEPLAEPRTDGDLSGDVFDLERTAEDRLEGMKLDDSGLRIRLLGTPVALFRAWQRRYYDLGRELRLLSLAHGNAYPVASELAEVFVEFERVRRVARGFDDVDVLLDSDRVQGDVTLVVPAGTPALMTRLHDALLRADEFCRRQRLLVLAATRPEAEFRDWYLGEYRRQGAGDPPLPWPGGYASDNGESGDSVSA